MASKKTNVNKKFGTTWLYIILAILGAASAIYGLVTLFTEPGNEIPKIGALIGGTLVTWWAVKKAIAKDKE
ncbi:MAG: hypothetical protein DBY00_07095 [Flavobacteriales bacterium]|nr:MAG: hypothetical protein DBY00_07095 [Flavobacteriales bacterium]